MSSFKRRSTSSRLPSSTRLSPHDSHLIISTGVPSLDDVLGGGIPIGSLILLKEDRSTGYAQLLLKYFAAQGVASENVLCVATAEENPQVWVEGLMAATDTKEKNEEEGDTVALTTRSLGALRTNEHTNEEDKMNIAWRYQGHPR